MRGRKLFLHVADDLVAVLLGVLATAHMYLEVFVIGGFHDELVKVAVGFYPVKPLLGNVHVRMLEVVIPGCVWGEWKVDVGSFSKGVLTCVCATYFYIQLVTSIT